MRVFLGALALFSAVFMSIPTGASDTSKVIILRIPQEVVVERGKTVDKKELDCMAANIYFEASTQERIGKIGVAQVTMNRVMSPEFPNSVCEVVFQGPKNKKHKHLCQFSWYCDGKPDVIRSKRMWRECIYIAKYVMLGGVPDITKKSTHYHADYVQPWWAKKMEKTVKLGDHIFYR